MKILVLYLRIVKRSDPAFPVMKDYGQSSLRFLETYRRFKPGIAHDLLVVNCGAYRPDALFDEIATEQLTAVTKGFDNGTYQEMNRHAHGYDLVVGCNTHVYFWRTGWLEKVVAAAQLHGPGFYGFTASYERNPHLRTPCIAYHPGVMAEYPFISRNREQCGDCEAGPDNFSLWAHSVGYPAILVTADGSSWIKPDWRKPPNIFRRGDQSNVLVYDRHTEIYQNASAEEKKTLERNADLFQPTTVISNRVVRPTVRPFERGTRASA